MAQLRVPVNPQTQAPQGQVGYERPVDISSGTRAIGDVVRHYGEVIQEEEKKREIFDVNQKLVDEANALQQDFADREKAAPLGAPNFTKGVNDDYASRHAEMVADLKKQGYSDEAVQAFGTRLGSLRGDFVAKAIEYQDKSRFAKASKDATTLAEGLSRYTNNNPDGLPSALVELQHSLPSLGFSQAESELAYEKLKDVVIKGAQDGFAVKHPEVILHLYGMPGELTTTSPTNLPEGQQFDLPAYLSKLSSAEGTGKNPRSSATGHFQFLDSTMLADYKAVYGNTGETKEQILAHRKDAKIMGKLGEYHTNQNVQGLVAANLPVNDATVYMAHFLGLKDAIDVLSAHADATISSLISSKSIAANPSIFKKVHTAADMLAWAQDKMNVEPQVIEAPAAQAISGAVTTSEPVADAQGNTGIPVLDLSTGPERMQMLTTARTIMNEREADAKAAQREAHSKWVNDFYTGLYDGKLGQADIASARQKGLLTDYDEITKAQGILDAKIKDQSDIQRFHIILNSGGKANPYSDQDQKAVDAGFKGAIEWDHKVGRNTNPALIALDIWNRTGVMPKQGSVMMRGALIGTDAQQVAGWASVATNMLQRNPNAFAGVEGGEEIGQQAATYKYYVDNLGMDATAAAQKIATMNSPEYKAKIKVDEKARTDFLKKINEGDVEVRLNKAFDLRPGLTGSVSRFFSGDKRTPGKFTSDSQLAEAKQTFAELAMSNYDRFHDEGAAIDYATDQMARFYGVENGRLLKYPASKGYPEIQGSREYVFDQAKEEVDKFVGKGSDIPKKDIWLQPTTSGSTADAFRAGHPIPYEVWFVTRENDQEIYHTIPGKAFVADIEMGKAAAAKKAREEEKKARERRINPQFGG